ncbi:MAG: dihydroneopterin aldolase [Balneolaceae bacterium]
MDVLTLKSMSFHARHGYFEEEKRTGNTFEVDLEFTLSLTEAAKSDDLSKTIDYSKARAIVTSIMDGTPVNLIETLCFNIGEQLFKNFAPQKLQVKVRKLHPPMEGETLYSEVCMQWPK